MASTGKGYRRSTDCGSDARRSLRIMGYAVDQVVVDGVSVTPTLSYIFTNVRAIPTGLWGAPKETAVRVSVLDLQSREVMVLAQGKYSAGWYQVNWSGRTERSEAPAGIY